MEPKHILFLTDVLYSKHAGAEGVLSKLTRLLPRDLYRCSIATFASDPDRVAVQSFDCPVHRLPLQRTYDRNALTMAIRLSQLIRSQKVSIVQTFFEVSDLFGGLIAKLSGCPILISSRRDMGFKRSALHRFAYRVTGGMFNQVQAVGDRVREWHIQHDRLDPRKVVTVYNGVDLDEIDGAPNARSVAGIDLQDGPVVVCVANIRRIKAMDVLVRTAAMVAREDSRVRFLVVGQVQETDYMREVQALVEQLHVSGIVTFTGASSEVPALLKSSQVFFLPSRSEGFSNALLEAMASALPCVATDVGGNPELIENDRNGYLVPIEDPASAAQRILSLLRNPEAAQCLGRAGRRIVEEKFSVEAMIHRVVELYERLLNQSGVDSKGQHGNRHLVGAAQ